MTLHQQNEFQKRFGKAKHVKELKRKDVIQGLRIVAQAVVDHKENEKTNRFVVAEEMQLFDADGRAITRWKGIVNQDNTEQMFSIVGQGYKIAQHDEVMDAIQNSVEELELTHEERVLTLNSNARIHVIMQFPKIDMALTNGEKFTMRVTFDNSYDSTTGLRMNIGTQTSKGYFLLSSEQFATYYHRHTKGMDVVNLKKKLVKGIKVFQDKIATQFQTMLDSKLDVATVLNFLDKSIKEKVISVKYLEMIENKLSQDSTENVDNQFALYSMIAEVLTAQVESVDAQKRHMETMYNLVKKL